MAHGRHGKLCTHFKSYTAIQLSLVRINPHDIYTLYSVTLMVSTKREKQQMASWDGLLPYLRLPGLYHSFICFVVQLQFSHL
jgi:hypothetical protein